MIRLTTLALAMLCATQLQAQDLKRADPNRPTDLIAADLGIPEQVFVTCFMNVAPDVDHAPTAARQQGDPFAVFATRECSDHQRQVRCCDESLSTRRPDPKLIPARHGDDPRCSTAPDIHTRFVTRGGRTPVTVFS